MKMLGFLGSFMLTASVVLACAVLISARSRHGNGEHFQASKNSAIRPRVGDNDWDYILFVQRWPASACVDGHVTGASQKCSFPTEMARNVSFCPFEVDFLLEFWFY